MAVLLKIAAVRVSSIQIMQVRVQNKGKSVWKSRYVGDVSVARGVAVDLLQMAKRVGPQCEAAEHEDLSGEKSLTLDCVVVD